MSESAITPFAWIFMLFSMGAVTGLAAYCYWRIVFGAAGTELADPTSSSPPGEPGGE